MEKEDRIVPQHSMTTYGGKDLTEMGCQSNHRLISESIDLKFLIEIQNQILWLVVVHQDLVKETE